MLLNWETSQLVFLTIELSCRSATWFAFCSRSCAICRVYCCLSNYIVFLSAKLSSWRWRTKSSTLRFSFTNHEFIFLSSLSSSRNPSLSWRPWRLLSRWYCFFRSNSAIFFLRSLFSVGSFSFSFLESRLELARDCFSAWRVRTWASRIRSRCCASAQHDCWVEMFGCEEWGILGLRGTVCWVFWWLERDAYQFWARLQHIFKIATKATDRGDLVARSLYRRYCFCDFDPVKHNQTVWVESEVVVCGSWWCCGLLDVNFELCCGGRGVPNQCDFYSPTSM